MTVKLVWATPDADKIVGYCAQRKNPPAITQDRASELFSYDEETGFITRKTTAGNSKKGTVIKTDSSAGYYRVLIDGQRYYVHQIAWVLLHGHWPKDQIDHIDNNRKNNAAKNLRVCTASQNCLNQQRARINNKIGMHGVHKLPSGKYRAQIQIQGVKLNLGLFSNAAEASQAYIERKELLNV